jgi:hypothetical protein
VPWWRKNKAISRVAAQGAYFGLKNAPLGGPAGPHELEGGLKQLEILLVLGRIGAVDLYPFPRTHQAGGLELDDVRPRELQLSRGRDGQAQSDAAAADAGEHSVADEVGVEAVDSSCGDARELEKEGVNLRLVAGRGGIGTQVGFAWEKERGLGSIMEAWTAPRLLLAGLAVWL